MTPWTIVHQAPLSMAFPRQEYWNGLPFPTPGDLTHPGIKHTSPALLGGFFTTELSRKPQIIVTMNRGETSGTAGSGIAEFQSETCTKHSQEYVCIPYSFSYYLTPSILA